MVSSLRKFFRHRSVSLGLLASNVSSAHYLRVCDWRSSNHLRIVRANMERCTCFPNTLRIWCEPYRDELRGQQKYNDMMHINRQGCSFAAVGTLSPHHPRV